MSPINTRYDRYLNRTMFCPNTRFVNFPQYILPSFNNKRHINFHSFAQHVLCSGQRSVRFTVLLFTKLIKPYPL